jgi:ketosteroid isomerase-like protein
MNGKDLVSSRRAFFLRGSAVLGAGVAVATGATLAAPATAAPHADDELSRVKAALAQAEDREALRALHAGFLAGMAAGDYDAVAALFADDAALSLSGQRAEGRAAIEHLLQSTYREQRVETLHAGYRHPELPVDGSLQFSADRCRATASLAAEADLCTPLRDTSTAAQMARLQGNVATRRWAPGRFEAHYRRTTEGWRIAALEWLPATA